MYMYTDKLTYNVHYMYTIKLLFLLSTVTAGTCTADEMKQIADTLYNKIQQELQQNHNDLKIEIHQLINRTSARGKNV